MIEPSPLRKRSNPTRAAELAEEIFVIAATPLDEFDGLIHLRFSWHGQPREAERRFRPDRSPAEAAYASARCPLSEKACR